MSANENPLSPPLSPQESLTAAAQRGWRQGGANWIGLRTLAGKEVGRFLAVYAQTVAAPAITTLLFYAVFALAFGGLERRVSMDLPYLEFLAPGLIMMAMTQNAFANTSSSLIIAKVQGNIVDVLMPPLSPMELTLGYLAGGIARGLVVGAVTLAAMILFVDLPIDQPFQALLFALLGTTFFSALGIAGGIWSEKFDHIAAVTNFVVTPLTFLSGTFYTIDRLPGIWQDAAQGNPVFYMIDGFRSGFIGHTESVLWVGLLMLAVLDALLIWLCWSFFKRGYKIKS